MVGNKFVGFIFQSEPAFIITNYHTSTYLSKMKKQGLEKRKEACKKTSGRKDYRLQPLEEEEQKCASALRLDLSNIAQYVDIVQAFAQKKPLPPLSTQEDNLANLLRGNLMSELDCLKEHMGTPVDSIDCQNIIQNILYENMFEERKVKTDLKRKNEGIKKRKEAAKNATKKKDYRLHPLTPDEVQFAQELHLDLSHISEYVPLVETFIQTGHLPATPPQGEDQLRQEKIIRGKLLKWQRNELSKIIEQMDSSDNSEDITNLTKSLLYDITVKESGLEMDVLIILPLSGLIIGR